MKNNILFLLNILFAFNLFSAEQEQKFDIGEIKSFYADDSMLKFCTVDDKEFAYDRFLEEIGIFDCPKLEKIVVDNCQDLKKMTVFNCPNLKDIIINYNNSIAIFKGEPPVIDCNMDRIEAMLELFNNVNEYCKKAHFGINGFYYNIYDKLANKIYIAQKEESAFIEMTAFDLDNSMLSEEKWFEYEDVTVLVKSDRDTKNAHYEDYNYSRDIILFLLQNYYKVMGLFAGVFFEVDEYFYYFRKIKDVENLAKEMIEISIRLNYNELNDSEEDY